MYLDYYYFILIVPVLIISLIAQARVNSAYNRFSRVQNRRGLTGAMAAQAVLDFYGVQGVRIEHVRGKLNDHYDPRSNVIRLSDGVYGSCSIAAVGATKQGMPHSTPRIIRLYGCATPFYCLLKSGQMPPYRLQFSAFFSAHSF